MHLNEKQKIVVESVIDASTNVTAGAGTGKTRVLVERYLRFVRDEGVSPTRLLALTFTLKAADEMRRRVYESVEKSDPRLIRELAGAWIMNFHSFGYRLIGDNAPAFGVDPGVQVATQSDLERISQSLKSRFLSGGIRGVANDFGGDVPSPTALSRRFDLIERVVGKCRDEVYDPDRLRDLFRATDAPGYQALVESVIAVFYAYQDELTRRRLIDFSDMIAIPARCLRSDPSLARRYTGRFDHILVDEFQDTSTAQYQLLEALAGEDFKNVTIVGDEKQAIYRWRDARPENIRDFPGEKKELSINYRSRQAILDLAHALVCMDPDHGGAMERHRLRASRRDESLPIVVFHPEASEAATDGAGDTSGDTGLRQSGAEAAALAAWIRHLTQGARIPGVPSLVRRGGNEAPLRYEDVAVLLRSLKASSGLPAFERAFEKNGIPYTVVGGANAAESRALVTLHALLSLLLPGSRMLELLLVLESEPFCLDDRSLMELLADREKEKPFDIEAVLSGAGSRVTNQEAAQRCEALKTLLDDLRRSWKRADFRLFLADALEKSPIYYRLFSEGVTLRAAEDIVGELFKIADDLDQRDALSLRDFLTHLGAAIDARSFGPDKDSSLPPNRVRIMTIHQAKGLEFPAVAIAGVKRPKAGSDGFFLSKETGLYLTEKGSWDRSYSKLDEYEGQKRTAAQEERCLLYVAITRAEDYLFVSSPFADGAERHGKTSLFADILKCLGEGDIPHAVFRCAPELPPPAERDAAANAADGVESLGEVASEWEAVLGLRRVSGADPPFGPDRWPVRGVNWSALRAFAACPLQYRYRYVLNLKDTLHDDAEGDTPARKVQEGDRAEDGPFPPGLTPAEYGVYVHEILRALCERPQQLGAGEKLDRFEFERIAERLGVEAAHKAGAVDRVLRIARAFGSSDVSRLHAGAKLEQPFEVRLKRAVFQGVFDRVEKTPEGYRVIDYKVGRERESHLFQVCFYIWALKKITGEKRVSGWLCFVSEETVSMSEVPATEADIDAHALALDAAFHTGVFEARPGRPCETCSFAPACPAVHLLDRR